MRTRYIQVESEEIRLMKTQIDPKYSSPKNLRPCRNKYRLIKL
jgi:hypothetical protein